MIDWLTLAIDATELGAEQVRRLRDQAGRVVKIAADGSIEWEKVARESIRSDSHQVTVSMGSRLMVCGSPARVLGLNNVFGSGDIRECAGAMLGFVCRQLQITLPAIERWKVTRVDVTHNYDLQDQSNVRQALMALRHSEGGRYQVKTSSESVYWSTQSKYRSGKSYAKGPHLSYLLKRGLTTVSESQLVAAARLLRLELSLKSEWWRLCSRKEWFSYSEQELDILHSEYFSALVGSLQVTEVSDIQDKAVQASLDLGFTEGRGRSAYLYWCAIQSQGFEHCRDNTPRRTHYRNVQILRRAGLSFADFQARNVIQLRRVPLVLSQPVRSWADLGMVG